MLAAIKALFRATHATPPPPSLVFDGSISIPRIGCFCSDDVSELLNIVLVSPGVPPKYPFDAYQSFVKSSPPSWGTFDFLLIDSIGASWSDDKYFPTIEVFGEDTYDAMSTYGGWGIMECKAHIDTDLFRSTTQIKRVRWNNRVEITNDGGSHHFAVLRHHIASGQNYSFSTMVEINIFERYIDEDLVRAAMDKYHFFIISIGTYTNLHRTYTSNVDFIVAERKHRYGKSIDMEDQNDRIVAVPLEHTKVKNHRAQLLDDLIRASQSSPEMCLDFNHYILCRI